MSDQKLEIQVDSQVAHGVYSNTFVVSSTAAEVSIDFIYQNYQQNLLQTRVILHPQKAEELVQVLEQQLQKYRENLSTQNNVN